MSSLSIINQYQQIIRCMSSCGSILVSYAWGHGINSSSSLNFFFHATTMLFYTVQRITFPKFCIFQKFITVHHHMALLQVALVSIPPHKFIRPPCWYYQLQEIVKYDFWVVPNGITSIPNFIQIHPVVLELNHVDRHDQPYMHSFHAHCTKNAF
jgi:hypothetical protein